jgi:hypothetical protein
MRLKLLVLTFLLSAGLATGQNYRWIRCFGSELSDGAAGVATDAWGNCFAAGTSFRGRR